MQIRNFQDLAIWQRSHQLTLKVYKLTKHLPEDERYGITNQVRRSSVSICANISEGCSKGTKEFIRYLNIARGSLEETKHYFILMKDLGYCSVEQYQVLFSELDQIGKMIYGLKMRLVEKSKTLKY